jgi:hypothetical protein
LLADELGDLATGKRDFLHHCACRVVIEAALGIDVGRAEAREEGRVRAVGIALQVVTIRRDGLHQQERTDEQSASQQQPTSQKAVVTSQWQKAETADPESACMLTIDSAIRTRTIIINLNLPSFSYNIIMMASEWVQRTFSLKSRKRGCYLVTDEILSNIGE